jgi:hypothetical protein
VKKAPCRRCPKLLIWRVRVLSRLGGDEAIESSPLWDKMTNDLVFCTRNGKRLGRRVVVRDMSSIAESQHYQITLVSRLILPCESMTARIFYSLAKKGLCIDGH